MYLLLAKPSLLIPCLLQFSDYGNVLKLVLFKLMLFNVFIQYEYMVQNSTTSVICKHWLENNFPHYDLFLIRNLINLKCQEFN